MTFLSGGFLLLVGALLIIYYVLPKRFRYLALLGGSVVFYTLAGRAYLPFLGITVLTVYGTALPAPGQEPGTAEGLRGGAQEGADQGGRRRL